MPGPTFYHNSFGWMLVSGIDRAPKGHSYGDYSTLQVIIHPVLNDFFALFGILKAQEHPSDLVKRLQSTIVRLDPVQAQLAIFLTLNEVRESYDREVKSRYHTARRYYSPYSYRNLINLSALLARTHSNQLSKKISTALLESFAGDSIKPNLRPVQKILKTIDHPVLKTPVLGTFLSLSDSINGNSTSVTLEAQLERTHTDIYIGDENRQLYEIASELAAILALEGLKPPPPPPGHDIRLDGIH